MKKALFTIATLAIIGLSNNDAKAQVVSTIAGTTTAGSANGTGAAASFNSPFGVAADGLGNLYVADQQNHEIRKLIISTGVVSTLAGNLISGSTDGTGVAASFNQPTGICTDGIGNLYVADQNNHEIRKIVIATGVVTTLAGSTIPGSADGIGAAASFNQPTGLCTDGSGNLYVADYGNNEIRKIVITTGVVSTLAGNTLPGSFDGTGAAAYFDSPWGVAVDGSGNLYVTDQSNHEIRKIVIATGVVTTLAGSTTFGSADGTGAGASFYSTRGIAADGSGNLYVADFGNYEIREIVIATAAVNTLAGSTIPGSADGIGSAASFWLPAGVAADGGNVYVADAGNNEIRKISLPGAGINQLGVMNDEVSIYPNPASELIIINVEGITDFENMNISLFDYSGRLVSKEKMIQSHTQINVAGLSSGLYFLQLQNENTMISKKFIKE